MQYQGGKEKIARRLSEFMLGYAEQEGLTHYLEPFLGGASVASRMALHFPGRATLSDVEPDLVSLWSAVRDGWVPPDTMTRERYNELRADPTPSPDRGFAVWGVSFGGKKWGGYTDTDTRDGKSYAGISQRSVLRKAPGLKGSEISLAGFDSHCPGAGTLVYCDPPYAGTTGYGSPFDSGYFWEVMDAWVSLGASVFVSEYNAPRGWGSVWSRDKRMTLDAATNSTTVREHLFVKTDTWL